ncbi:hypothetical protein ACJDU8_00520 [Clostridium sp. WILCCON 0269]|uniref:Uncharacterized protein n=1 Tax=Candidatus Clostridium eludens TaxID=3381663 RepID=A0ABW8SFW7_9CLOT
MNFICNIMKSSIMEDLILGFLYSAIIGLVIFVLSYLVNKRDSLKDLLIDLIKVVLALTLIKSSINKICELNGKEYGEFFISVLDKKEIKPEEFKSVNEFIIYDKISYLPNLNNYLVDKFYDKFNDKDGIEIGELNELLGESKDEKDKYIKKNSECVVSIYEYINNKITKINNMLDYYKKLTLEMINIDFDNFKEEISAAENKYRVFKICVDSLIEECKTLNELLSLLTVTIKENRQKLEKELCYIKKILRYMVIIFIVIIIISLLLLIIA